LKQDTLFATLSPAVAPDIKVTPPGPKSKAILDFQSASESSAISYAKGMPMALESGKGATLKDVDGNVYIDMFGGAGVMAMGHAHPDILKEAHKEIDQVTHALDIPTPTRQKMVKSLQKVSLVVQPVPTLSSRHSSSPSTTPAVTALSPSKAPTMA